MIATTLAFLRRDFLIMISYRLAFLWQVLGVLGMIALFFFVGKLAGDSLTDPVQSMSEGYFDYLLAGIAFTDVFTFGLGSFPRTVRDGQAVGTLEAMLLTHSRLFPIIIYSSLFSYLNSLMRLVVFASVAIFGFGLWHDANPVSVAAVFLLASSTFACLGVISASFVLVLKQGDPIIGLYGLASVILGGVLFPISILPGWMQPLADFVPLYPALTGIRLALQGAPLEQLSQQIVTLAIMTTIFLPAGVISFNWAINRAKKEGSLVQY